MNYPALLAFFFGFISLSIEILWVRLYGFTMLSTPAAFGFVLMSYLVGIAFGAKWGGKACHKHTRAETLWQHAMFALFVSAVVTLVAPFVFAWAHNQWWRAPLFDFMLIAFVSSILAYVFPIAHHLGAGVETGKQGQRFAWVYTSNVMGAALGPLVTGYVLLNLFSLQQVFVLLACVQLLAVAVFYWLFNGWRLRLPVITGALSLALMVGLTAQLASPHGLIQRVSFNKETVQQVVENKYGVITIFSPTDTQKYEEGDDAVYGGNVYDGRTNLSLRQNTNGLDRPLLLSALQPEPKRVLMIGLSIGTWLALTNGFPGVEHVDVVEINAGYLKAAQAYPLQAEALEDSRVNVIVDDARRWLKRHPEERYDLVIMNTTWHWRANSSFLLSKEFLQLVRKHMAEEAVVAFNATGSPDAFYTATNVFEHAYRYSNFVYAAGFDFRPRKDSPKAREIYSRVVVDGEPIFAPEDELIEEYLGRRFVDIEVVQKVSERPLEVITDNNAITEFKYGYSLMRLYR